MILIYSIKPNKIDGLIIHINDFMKKKQCKTKRYQMKVSFCFIKGNQIKKSFAAVDHL
jgi:hypothetical protein